MLRSLVLYNVFAGGISIVAGLGLWAGRYWALWLAASLIRWLRLAWVNFSLGGFRPNSPTSAVSETEELVAAPAPKATRVFGSIEKEAMVIRPRIVIGGKAAKASSPGVYMKISGIAIIDHRPPLNLADLGEKIGARRRLAGPVGRARLRCQLNEDRLKAMRFAWRFSLWIG
ncbi:MAG: hypothetical protein HC793_03590, partial [Aquincola sp.]|nr:hypothetical protein [Aquincola sp.]